MAVALADARTISEEIDAAVAEILSKHGLDKGRTKFKYGAGFQYTVDASPLVANENGVNTESAEARDWKFNAKIYASEAGVEDFPSDVESLLGVMVSMQGKGWKFIGSNYKARKYPLLFESVEGKVYKFPTGMGIRALAAAVPANA